MDAANHWLELDSARLRHNLARLRGIVGATRIVAVLKANAYGAGAVGMARVLAREGVDAFAVANVPEGVELRRAGVEGMLLCLTYFTRAETGDILDYALTPAVFTPEAAAILAEAAGARQRQLPVWVKVDTGLNRLGVPHADAPQFIARVSAIPSLNVTGVFSTVAENPARDGIQLERMLALRARLPELRGAAYSIASSHAILAQPGAYLDAVRPGISLLGFEPSERERLNMRLVQQADLQPIATWKARVGYAKVVPAGEQAGYGVQPALARDTPVATLAIGWADGYPAAASNGGTVLARGAHCPVLAVSANSTLVDASAAPDLALGEEVVLLGRQGDAEITPYDLARATGSVYRLLTGIAHETPRLWA